MKDTIYAWLNEMREIPPSEWFSGQSIPMFTEIGAFTVKRDGSNLLLYPPHEYEKKGEPIKCLVFALIPIDFSNQWIKPACFDDADYHGRADNWENWWNYYFGKVNSHD